MERLSRDGVSFCFEDVGKGAPPVVLIHDLGSDHTFLGSQCEHLRGRHRVVAVDLLGHGQSDNLPMVYAVARFAEDVAWLCYELGLYHPVAVGRGIGGAIAIELANRCPNLLVAVVVLRSSVALPARTPTKPHLTGTWENAQAWDGAAAAAACMVPLLYCETDRSGTDLNTLHGLCPSTVEASMKLVHPQQFEGEEQVNAAIDAFVERVVMT